MFPNDDSTTVATPPLVPAVGSPGYFSDGNLATGIEGTFVPAWFLNMLVAELRAPIDAANINLNKGDNTQLLQAIRFHAAAAANQFAAGRFIGSRSFSTPGTYLYQWSANTRLLRIFMCGAGGGSGFSTAPGNGMGSAAGGGGGGGSGEAEVLVSGLPASGVVIVVGDAGRGGAFDTAGNPIYATPGGTTSFGNLLSCTGGSPGFAGQPTTQGLTATGFGGQPIGPFLIASRGTPGTVGIVGSPTSVAGGAGGQAIGFGAGGGPGQNAQSQGGQGPGGGAGGAASSQNTGANSGNNGAPGMIVVEEFTYV